MEKCAMFGFLLDEASKPSVDLDILKEFAKEASTSFLGVNNIPLNQSILKIAESESLTPDSVDIICQETNKLVHAGLFKNAEDRYVVFDLANPSDIIQSLESPDTEKLASTKYSTGSSFEEDYSLAPGEKESYFSDFTITKTASGGHEGLYNVDKYNEKKSLEKKAWDETRRQEAIIIKTAQVETLEREFVKISRDHLLEVPLRDREALLPHISFFAKEAGLGQERSSQLMGYLGKVLVHQGLIEKTADLKADPSLISDQLGITVINGTHPLSGIIKTIVKKDKELEILKGDDSNIIKTRVSVADAKGSILGQKLRSL